MDVCNKKNNFAIATEGFILSKDKEKIINAVKIVLNI